VFGGPEPLHRYNHCKHWSFLGPRPLQRRYRGVTGRYKRKRELARGFRDCVADGGPRGGMSAEQSGECEASDSILAVLKELSFGGKAGADTGRRRHGAIMPPPGSIIC